MKLFVQIISLLALLFLGACGGSTGSDTDAGTDAGVKPCNPESNPCPDGQRCDAEAKCVQADPLTITTSELPSGRVDFGYEYKLEASGGLPPYSWSISDLDASLSFMSIKTDGTLQGTASEAVSDASISIAVKDSGFGDGLSIERSYTLSFDQCKQGDSELCYTPTNDRCAQGAKTCTDGVMGECITGEHLSSDRNHCGPLCDSCDSDKADSCTDGLCSCGQGSICQDGMECCDGECVDVSISVSNCGSCFHDCALAISHSSSSEKTCSAGQCDYSGVCDQGWLDCDGTPSNGCERPSDRLDSCGACDIDCNDLVTHVPSAQKTCEQVNGVYKCSYTSACSPDFADCDSDRSNGCETWLTQPESCGGCEVDCSQSSLGTQCISPDQGDPYYHVCGCDLDPQSGASIGCSDGELCCHHVCVDINQDAQNCGVCDASCMTGTCVESLCQCSTDQDCPQSSPGTSCGVDGNCVCAYFQAGTLGCQAGWYCCDGQHGGSGGPDGDQDLGCCPKRCGWNDSENFPCSN